MGESVGESTVKHYYAKLPRACLGTVALDDVRLQATVVQEVEKSFNNQKVACSIPCRSVLE